jgi:hypothetical protein
LVNHYPVGPNRCFEDKLGRALVAVATYAPADDKEPEEEKQDRTEDGAQDDRNGGISAGVGAGGGDGGRSDSCACGV